MSISINYPFSIPPAFEETLKECEKELDNDKEFALALKQMSARYNKKRKNNKLRSAKIRFLYAYYLRIKKRERINKLKEETK